MISKPDTWIGFDFETSGLLPEYALQPWRIPQGKTWPTSLVFNQNGLIGGGLLDVEGARYDRAVAVDIMRVMLETAATQKRTLVGWNTVFDISILLAYPELVDLVFKCSWADGMLMWRQFFIEPEYDMDRSKKKHYGLKTYVEEFMPDEAGYEQEIDFHDASPEARAKLHTYNIADVDKTLRGARSLWSRLSPTQRRVCAIEAESLPMLAHANLHGLPVDYLVAHELQQNLVDTATDRLGKLAEHGVTEKIVRSPKQLSKLLFDDWKLPVYKENESEKTGNVSRSTDKEVLHELSFIDPRAKVLREYRESLNQKTKFADGPLISADYNGDNRAHPLAIPFGTYSGRLTYASKQGKNKDARPVGFALHQMKRGPKFRSVVTTPLGYKLLEFDAAGQEFRWMAIASRDDTMLQLCMPGEDAHSYMASRIIGMDYQELVKLQKIADAIQREAAKKNRDLGKLANLSLQYRTSAKKLRVVARVDYNIPMELPQAERIHSTYARTYKGVPIYWEKQIREVKQCGYVETFAGRRVQVIGNWGNRKLGWAMGSTAINYRIQGTGADQKYLAMMILKDELHAVGGIFAWDLHDGLYMWVPDAKAEAFADKAQKLLDNLPYKEAWGFTPPIALLWDCKIGGSWGTLKAREA